MTARLVANQGKKTLIYLFLGLVAVVGMAACASAEPSFEKAIVGQWTNPQGGVIHFYADKTGFIPGDEGQIPAIPSVKFTYNLQDETHLGIRMDGQESIVVEIKLEGDTITWFTRNNDARFVYTRAK